MAINAAAVAIPAPANDAFVNGEQGVGIAGSPAPLTPYFASRIFKTERSGFYQLKIWCNGLATLHVGRDQATLQQALNMPASTVVNAHLYLRKGVNRVDVLLQAAAASSCLFAMLIYQPDEVVYASSPAGWVYDTAGVIPDDEVPAPASNVLPVFSTLPNWASPVVERIGYLTDILQSEASTEQARSVRYFPRRSIEAQFLRADTGRSRLDAFLVGIGRKPFLVPLWQEQYRVQADMTSGSTTVQFPPLTLALREFQVGDRVFVNDGNPENFEVLTIQSLDYDTDVLTWVVGPSATWATGTRIIPLRRAYVADQGQLSAPVDRVGRGSLRFELADPEYRFGAAWGHCSPLWQFPINRGEDISFAYDRNIYAFDNSVGPVEFADPGGRTTVTMRSALVLRGRPMVVAFRRFIEMAAGRAGRFYMPTLMSDIMAATDTLSGTALDARPAGFSEFILSAQPARSIVGLIFRDGTPPAYHSIVDVTRVGGVERFTLDTPITSVPMTNVRRIQFMVPSRFDQDTFELSHLVDDSAVVRTAVVTRSVDAEDMLGIECP